MYDERFQTDNCDACVPAIIHPFGILPLVWSDAPVQLPVCRWAVWTFGAGWSSIRSSRSSHHSARGCFCSFAGSRRSRVQYLHDFEATTRKKAWIARRVGTVFRMVRAPWAGWIRWVRWSVSWLCITSRSVLQGRCGSLITHHAVRHNVDTNHVFLYVLAFADGEYAAGKRVRQHFPDTIQRGGFPLELQSLWQRRIWRNNR